MRITRSAFFLTAALLAAPAFAGNTPVGGPAGTEGVIDAGAVAALVGSVAASNPPSPAAIAAAAQSAGVSVATVTAAASAALNDPGFVVLAAGALGLTNAQVRAILARIANA